MQNDISLIMAIINSGYSELTMDLLRDAGARGGTIFNSFGSAGVSAEKLYGVAINPEKEVVMVLVPKALVSKLLPILYENVGPNTLAQGIAFSLPVEETTSNLVMQYKEKKKDSHE